MRLALHHDAIRVSDQDRSGTVHSRALGAKAGVVPHVVDRLSNGHRPGSAMMPDNGGMRRAWPRSIDEVVARSERACVSFEPDPVERMGSKRSVHPRDPNGSLLEFLSYDR